MYGLSLDCKGKVEGEESLRQCIRLLVEMCPLATMR
jgi:hypothetical protein